MKSINILGMYVLFVGSIIAAVLTITLSKTMSFEHMSLESLLLPKRKIPETMVSERNENKFIPPVELAFSQDPFIGEKHEKKFLDSLTWDSYKKSEKCDGLAKIILEDCIGMWEKRDNCDVLQDDFENCFVESPKEQESED